MERIHPLLADFLDYHYVLLICDEKIMRTEKVVIARYFFRAYFLHL